MASKLAKRVEKWEKWWRKFLRQVTAVITPSSEEEAWRLIDQWGNELFSEMMEAKKRLRGTPGDPDAILTLYGPQGLFVQPGEKPLPADRRQLIDNDSYQTYRFLGEIWSLHLLCWGERSAVQVAVDIQRSWARFHEQAQPVLLYNLLRILGQNEDALAFAAAVKAPGHIKAGSRTDVALRREAAGRMEPESLLDTLRGDLPGTVASLPHYSTVDVKVEGVSLRLNLTRPLLPTTPEGIDDFYLGVKQEIEKRRRSPTGLVVDLVGVPETPLAAGFSLDEVQETVSQDPLYLLTLDEEGAEASERAERILREITALPGRQQATFRMRLAGMSYAEIAEELGISDNGVRKNLDEARKKLRKKLG